MVAVHEGEWSQWERMALLVVVSIVVLTSDYDRCKNVWKCIGHFNNRKQCRSSYPSI